jgi:23S rRNA (cytosine1962-C5)-methyltransferase
VLVAGETLPMPLTVRENGLRYEVRLDEGFSTGLFLDQRENRRALMQGARGIRALNLFAHTCSFGVALAAAGAATANVDVSRRYLDWGRRNYALNGLDPETHRFHAMDAFRYLDWAAGRGLRHDLLILDPPTFSTGTKRRGVPPFSAERDYARLVEAALPLLAPGGRIFAATNAASLCRKGALRERILRALGRAPEWLPLPGAPPDFRGEGAPVSVAALFRPAAARPRRGRSAGT